MANEKDTLTKAFMERPDIFADAFNFLIYDGEQVIKPEELREIDTAAIALPFGTDGVQTPVQRYRDVFKQWVIKRDEDAAYLLLGVENQSDIHYAMPVRSIERKGSRQVDFGRVFIRLPQERQTDPRDYPCDILRG